jgi:hypothetical protein
VRQLVNKDFNIINMHGTTVKIKGHSLRLKTKLTLFREGGVKFTDVEKVLDKCDLGSSIRCL